MSDVSFKLSGAYHRLAAELDATALEGFGTIRSRDVNQLRLVSASLHSAALDLSSFAVLRPDDDEAADDELKVLLRYSRRLEHFADQLRVQYQLPIKPRRIPNLIRIGAAAGDVADILVSGKPWDTYHSLSTITGLLDEHAESFESVPSGVSEELSACKLELVTIVNDSTGTTIDATDSGSAVHASAGSESAPDGATDSGVTGSPPGSSGGSPPGSGGGSPPGSSGGSPPGSSGGSPPGSGGGSPPESGGGGDDASVRSIKTYAHIEIASSIRIGDEQPLRVGISPDRQANVSGDAMSIVGGYPFDLTVTVVAQEFVLRAGERWSHTLHATAEEPSPTVVLHVTPIAEASTAGVDSRTIAVLYSMDAKTVGYGALRVDVLPAEASPPDPEPKTAEAVLTAYPNHTAFDLEIRINDFGDGSGRLKWTFLSPHFPISHEPVSSKIGSAPGDFAADLIREINSARSPKITALLIAGNSAEIARAMPALFRSVWKKLSEVMGGRIPAVLIVSEDAYVPWELATVNELFDPDAPALLGAQADVGRWIFSDLGDLPLPPPDQLALTPMVEVTAVYTSAKSPRLEHAEEEGRELARLYGAAHVDATDIAIVNCFHEGDPPATTMHVALHGIYDQNSPVFGLIMSDDQVLTPATIRGATARRKPFVFLNACQVGTGKEVLGQYAGMPAAFVYAKARGVVAPLWSVEDGPAKDVALRFYDGLLHEQSPAALLRAERKNVSGTASVATSLAYVYFGNPRSHTTPPAVVAG